MHMQSLPSPASGQASLKPVHGLLLLLHAAGQEEFDTLTRAYYRGAGAAVLAFSTTDRASFDALATWKGKIEAECGDIAIALVQNKVGRP